MKPLVSVIVPNYNAEKYISKCISSILAQSYNKIEIVIVDDGSSDKSWKVIKKLSNENTCIKAFRQENMNASIARNKGIELANGEYFLFLDSDDILYPDAVKVLVDKAIYSEADIVIGNYNQIDVFDCIIKNCNAIDKEGCISNPIDVAGFVPNPSNKLYSARIVRDNGIIFGNVRIGQDLNFFLKFIACSHKVYMVDTIIYGWRILQGSISNSYNFRIFDIIESFKNVRDFYIKLGKKNIYDEYLSIIEYRHYYLQMEKQKYFKNKKSRNIVIEYFKVNLNGINVKKCINFNEYKSDYIRCQLKIWFSFLYKLRIYYYIDKFIKTK